MIKVRFEKVTNIPLSRLVVYDNITRIPFSLEVGAGEIGTETQYTRYIKDQNFIEFRFNKNNSILYDVTLVSFQDSSVFYINSDIQVDNTVFYSCIFIEDSGILENPIKIKKGKDFLNISFMETQDVKYFMISEQCALGINSESILTSIIILSLTDIELNNILGQ